MEQFDSQDPRSYSLYFDLKIWFRARNVTGTFEKRAPGTGCPYNGSTRKEYLFPASGIWKGRQICSMFQWVETTNTILKSQANVDFCYEVP